MAYALQRGLLAALLALGVPTSPAATKDKTTDTRCASESIDEFVGPGQVQFSVEEAPWLEASRQSHWLREYLGYEYRGLERVIYDMDRADISQEEIEEFQRTLRTHRGESDRRLMVSVLSAHGALPPERFVQDISFHVGYRPFANDIYLLRQIHDDARLRELFFDRARLVSETRTMLPSARAPRSDNEGRIYIEDPPLEPLDSLNLLRLNLYLQAVNDPSVQEQIRDIIIADLANRRTEFGGVAYIDDTHHVRFQPIMGEEYGNGSYAGQYYRPLIRALGTFHLHATGDGEDHRYSGPSVPDLRAARMTNTTGVVITLLRQSEEAYTVNIDFYYVDPRTYNDLPISASNPVELSPRTVRVVDMGVFTMRRR